jgi:hypothetical protein
MAESHSDWRGDLALIALPALAVFAYGAFSPVAFIDGDPFWHVATGRWILAHGAVPTVDPFSFSAFGHRWVDQEWLSEVLMALAWLGADWSGVLLLIGAAAGAAFALMAAELRRWLGVLSVIVCLALSFVVLMPHFLARPHVIALPLIVIWTIQLLRARRLDRAPPAWLVAMMALWANLHGDFLVALAIGGCFALEAVLAARVRGVALLGAEPRPVEIGKPSLTPRLRTAVAREAAALARGGVFPVALKWGGFLVAATLATVVTPNGVAGLFYPFQVLSMKDLRAIGEWQAASFQGWSSLEAALILALSVCLFRGVRLPAVRLGFLLLLLHLTLQHQRQEIVLVMIAPLLLAQPLAAALEPARSASGRSIAWPPLRAFAALAGAVTIVFASIAGWRLTSPVALADGATTPITALARVPAALRARPVFNAYIFGGWLIYKGVRPFMDGRSDMYGDDLFRLYLDAERADPKAVDTILRRYDVAWTILPPSSNLVARLDATPGWRRLYADKWAVVQARAPGGAGR